MFESQVKSGTVDAPPSCSAVAAIRRSCISLIADIASERSKMARSSGTTFAAPVRGPLCLGHSCHFGLGLFLPGENKEAPMT